MFCMVIYFLRADSFKHGIINDQNIGTAFRIQRQNRDSWFSSPSSIHAVKQIGYDVIAMVNIVKDGRVIPAEVVFVRSRNKRKEYLCIISIDIELDENEIIRIYGKRCDIKMEFSVYLGKPKKYTEIVKEQIREAGTGIDAKIRKAERDIAVVKEEERTKYV